MDKQLLLTAVRFTQCRLVPYIANTVLYWQHFSRLVPAVPGCSIEHKFAYIDLHWIKLLIIIQNFLKLLKTHQSQPLWEVWFFCDYPVTLFELLIAQMCQIKHCHTRTLNSIQLRFHSVCMWCPASISHETVNFIKKSHGVIELLCVECCEIVQNSP